MTGPTPPVTPNDPSPTSAPDRESFLQIALAGAVPLAIGEPVAFGTPTAGAAPPLAFHGPDAVPVKLRINGKERTVALEPRVTLLDALREYLGLPGTKKGCNHGECGACTVHLDGRRVNACLVLAIAAAGREVTTIEHLDRPDELHPMQQAFIDQDAFQCGAALPARLCPRSGT
jgi:xanthine dehydrogenase YagT iron-sulfur-binding subunit